MIEPQFENAGQFNNGVAFVWYYIGREEDMKTVPLGEEYKSHERFNLQGNRRTGIIDSTGKYIVEPKINFNGTSFKDGVSLVRINKSIEIVDTKGGNRFLSITNHARRRTENLANCKIQ
jgi:hypothetical protein